MRKPYHPEVIFANIVNQLMVAQPSPAYIKAMTAVTPRKIWLSEEGDVIVTPRAIEDRFKRYACSILGIDPDKVTTLSPDGESQALLPVAVLQSNLFEQLRALISQRPGIDLLGFALDKPLIELAKALEVPLHGYNSYPDADVQAVLYKLNTKSGFREAAESIGLRVPPGGYCEGIDPLVDKVQELLPITGGVIVKQNRSSNGFYHLIFRQEDVADCNLKDYLINRLRAFPEQPHVFTVEALMPFISVPSVEIEVDDEGVRLLYLCDQRCPNNSFTGMVTPPIDLAPIVEEELLRIGKLFGEYVRKLGFRGVCDVDTGLTEDRAIYVTETNFRRTGGTYLDTLMRRLIGDNYLDTHVWWADVRLADGDRDFFKGWAALKDVGLAFDPAKGRGVLLTADTLSIDGKWRYLVIAPSHEMAAQMEAELGNLLRLRELA